MLKTIFNVIDVWDTTHRHYDTTGEMEWARRRLDPFAKYLSDILLYYQESGAHINVSLPDGQTSNSNFKVIPNSYINDSDELKEYIDSNELDELLICGIHLFACVHEGPTGYYSMVELFENTKIAVTLTQPMKPISLANEWCYY
ncbi:hypothetical protein HOE22_05065 [Candidatus Woesearchaeota archaeon]|jgi:hypothetical protein|nr:hypothetical protein [Candidatus Woesearchaeota archaeon]MBT7556026.1 hypothetical protein [Candidatus Woesearchaeota archaeon]